MAIGLKARRIAFVTACIVGSLILLAVAAIWFAGREATLQMALQRLAAATGGALTIEGAQGSLYSPVKIRRILYENAKQRIEARDVELDWEPRELLAETLHVRHLHVATLEVRSKQASDEPLSLPASLRLPLAIKIDEARLATLSIINRDATPILLKDLAANGESRGATHTLNLTAIDSPWASGNGHLELGADRPFPLHATINATGRAPRAYTLAAKAGGSLAAIEIAADGATQGGKAVLEVKVAPFAKAPIQAFTLNARDVDLHDIDAALPFTQLAAEAMGSIDEKGVVNASVRATNALPGTIDQQRIPLKSLKGQVAGTVERFTANDLAIDLGNGGQFTGEGGMVDGQAHIALATKNLNVQGVYGKLRATQAAGTLALTTAGKNFSEQRVQADLNDGKLAMRLRIDAFHGGNDVRIDAAQLTAAGGELSARGKLAQTGKQAFDLTGKLTRFNPAAFGKFPVASLGADVRASGQLAAPITAGIEFTLSNSTLRGQPLAGHGKLSVAQNRIAQADVTLDLAGNRLDAKGAYGRAGDELAWQVDATDLARLDPGLAGRARGKGTLRGTPDDPAGSFELSGNGLRLPGQVAIAALEAHGDVGAGKDGAIDLHVAADTVKQGGLSLTQAKADATGTRTRHTLQLIAQGQQGIDLTSELSGGWDLHQGWSGQITRLVNRGRYAVELSAPAPLVIAPGRFELRAASLTLAEGRLAIESVNWSPGKLSTRGATTGLSLAWLQKLFPNETRADDVKATLTLGGRWSLDIGESVSGSVRLAREGGDLTLVSDPPLALGLTQLDFTADIVQNRIKASFDLQGKTAGTLNVRADTLLARRDGIWGLPGDAPLNVEATGDVPSLAWTGLFLNPGYAVDGRAKLRLSRKGTVRSPQVSGTLEADGLALRVADYGVNLKNGVLRATFEENRVLLTQFRMGADEGELTASGSLKLGQAESGIAGSGSDIEGGADIRADKLAILNHPDYRLTVSGNGKVAFAGGKLAITGEVRADKGAIRLPENNRPGLSDDVVVVGKPNSKAKKTGATPISIDLSLDVGNNFQLSGYGLEASLGGSLRVKSAPPGLPYGSGTIRVTRGTYEAYGQKLEIERGVLSFAGPIDNPSLDILAVRKNLAVEPGVAITGTALGPRVKLVSDPPVPDTEKLAWLVLGHGIEGSSGGELDLLPVAAAALLSSNGRGPTKGIAQTFGLDEIGLSRNSASGTSSSTATGSTLAEQRVLTVGKRVSSKLYLTYEAGLDAATRVVRLQYEISRRWSVRAETGTRSALDLFFTLRFD